MRILIQFAVDGLSSKNLHKIDNRSPAAFLGTVGMQ